MKASRFYSVKFYYRIGVPVLVVLLALFGYGLKEYNRTALEIATTQADYRITAQEFTNEFAKNWQTSEGKFKGKLVEVFGEVKKIETADSLLTISLADNPKIRCSMEDASGGKLIKVGDSITLKGEYVGYNQDELLGNDILLKRCVLVP